MVWAVIIDIEHPLARLPDTTVYYALSTIAQSAAALAAILGAFGLWRLGYLLERDREEEARENQTRSQLIKVRTRREYTEELTGVKQDPGGAERQIGQRLKFIDVRRWHYRQQWDALNQMLGTVLLVTLTILVLAISGLAFVEGLLSWVWTMRVGIILAGLALGIGPAIAIWNVVRQSRLPLPVRREGIHE